MRGGQLGLFLRPRVADQAMSSVNHLNPNPRRLVHRSSPNSARLAAAYHSANKNPDHGQTGRKLALIARPLASQCFANPPRRAGLRAVRDQSSACPARKPFAHPDCAISRNSGCFAMFPKGAHRGSVLSINISNPFPGAGSSTRFFCTQIHRLGMEWVTKAMVFCVRSANRTAKACFVQNGHATNLRPTHQRVFVHQSEE